MLDYKLDYGIKWMVGLQKYLEDKDTRTIKWFNNHLSRGHVVEAELFGHFNKELTFAHPCVVLMMVLIMATMEDGCWLHRSLHLGLMTRALLLLTLT